MSILNDVGDNQFIDCNFRLLLTYILRALLIPIQKINFQRNIPADLFENANLYAFSLKNRKKITLTKSQDEI